MVKKKLEEILENHLIPKNALDYLPIDDINKFMETRKSHNK